MSLARLVWFEENPSAAPEAALQATVQLCTEKSCVAPDHTSVLLNWPGVISKRLFIEQHHYFVRRNVHMAFIPALRRET